eukprot:scaffold60256_cov55-Attheya_sp.AAC.2
MEIGDEDEDEYYENENEPGVIMSVSSNEEFFSVPMETNSGIFDCFQAYAETARDVLCENTEWRLHALLITFWAILFSLLVVVFYHTPPEVRHSSAPNGTNNLSDSQGGLDKVTHLLMELGEDCPCSGKKENVPWHTHEEYHSCINTASTILFQRNDDWHPTWTFSTEEQEKIVKAAINNECGTHKVETLWPTAAPTIRTVQTEQMNNQKKAKLWAQMANLMVSMENVCPCAHPSSSPVKPWKSREEYVNCLVDAMVEYFDPALHVDRKVDDAQKDIIMEAVLDNNCAKDNR